MTPKQQARRYTLGPDINLDQEEVLDGTGKRITETRAAQMAEYALGRVRRGRPPVGGRPGRTPTINVRVAPAIKASLQEFAAAEHRALSDVAREALAEYVERRRARAARGRNVAGVA